MEVTERFIAVLDLSIPDRVPIFVQSIMPAFGKQCRSLLRMDEFRGLEGRNGILDFSVHRALGIEGGLARGDSALLPNLEGDLRVDACDLPRPDPKIQPDGDRFVDFYGRIMETGQDPGGEITWYVGPYLRGEADFEAWDYLYPRPLEEKYVEDLLWTVQAGEGLGFLPVPICQGLFAKTAEMFGFVRVARMCRQNTDFLERVLDRLLDIKLDIIDQYHSLQIPVVAVSDDVALKNSVFVSPQDYDKFFVPRLRKLTQRAESYGIRTILHSDGYVTPLLPGVIRAGFNAIECLEPGAGVNLGEVKSKYGGRICLIGGIDVPHLLSRASLEEVQRELVGILEIGMPGGAFSLCPAGDLLQGCRFENVQEIARVRDRLGVYS